MLQTHSMNPFKNFPATTLAVFVGMTSYGLLFFLFGDIDLFEKLIGWLAIVETYEVDEFLIPSFLILVALVYDLLHNHRMSQQHLEIQAQRLRVLKVTMNTVHHIVNNALNNLQIVKMQIEEHQSPTAESTELMDKIIHETAAKLRLLGDLNDTPEIQVSTGIVEIDYGQRSDSREPNALTRSGS
jgi:hypothetical protein